VSDSATSTAQPLSTPAMPWWAMLLIAAVVTGFVACTVSIGSAINYGAYLSKHGREPAYINKVVGSIAVLSDPLPEGFQYQMAASIFNNNVVTLVHKPDGSVFMLGSMGADSKTASTKEILQQMANQGIPGFAESFKIDKEGRETVAGQTMDYVSGTATDNDPEERSVMLGCILNKEKNRMILLCGRSPASSFNLEAARKLMANIKELK
jgi:hypothetical protein